MPRRTKDRHRDVCPCVQKERKEQTTKGLGGLCVREKFIEYTTTTLLFPTTNLARKNISCSAAAAMTEIKNINIIPADLHRTTSSFATLTFPSLPTLDHPEPNLRTDTFGAGKIGKMGSEMPSVSVGFVLVCSGFAGYVFRIVEATVCVLWRPPPLHYYCALPKWEHNCIILICVCLECVGDDVQ